MVSYLACSQACQSCRRFLVEGELGPVAADAVVDLPGDELGVFAQGLAPGR